MCVFIFLVKVTEWPPIGKIAAHSAYDMFSWYKCLIVNLVCSHLGFWSGNFFFLISLPTCTFLSMLGNNDKKNIYTHVNHSLVLIYKSGL